MYRTSERRISHGTPCWLPHVVIKRPIFVLRLAGNEIPREATFPGDVIFHDFSLEPRHWSIRLSGKFYDAPGHAPVKLGDKTKVLEG